MGLSCPVCMLSLLSVITSLWDFFSEWVFRFSHFLEESENVKLIQFQVNQDVHEKWLGLSIGPLVDCIILGIH